MNPSNPQNICPACGHQAEGKVIDNFESWFCCNPRCDVRTFRNRTEIAPEVEHTSSDIAFEEWCRDTRSNIVAWAAISAIAFIGFLAGFGVCHHFCK